jgi:hypothetical protein
MGNASYFYCKNLNKKRLSKLHGAAFAKEYIDFNVDTNYSSDYVAIEINIKNQDDLKPFKIYKVRNLVINVEPSEKLLGANHDTITTNNFKYIPYFLLF